MTTPDDLQKDNETEPETIAEYKENNPEWEAIFTRCNVCGRSLKYMVEEEMGLCMFCMRD